jgi:AhpD family alkylhydroperoxidase
VALVFGRAPRVAWVATWSAPRGDGRTPVQFDLGCEEGEEAGDVALACRRQEGVDDQASQPDISQGVREIFQAVYSGGVPPQTLELVHLRASQINGCSACTDAGATNAPKAGVSVEKLLMLAAWYEDPRFDDAERAALAFTEAMTRLADWPGAVTDEIWAEAARHYDERQLGAPVLMVSITNSSTGSAPPSGYPPGSAGLRNRWSIDVVGTTSMEHRCRCRGPGQVTGGVCGADANAEVGTEAGYRGGRTGLVIAVAERGWLSRWPNGAGYPECWAGLVRAAGSRVRRRRSMRASWKPTVRAAASTVAPWLIRCSARSSRRSCW